MSKRQYKRLWSVVKGLILENYKTILERSIRGTRGSRGIRASYYIVGDLLGPLIGSGISQEDYVWYLSQQGYASYRDDIWPMIEQKHGLERPAAKALGVVYDNGLEFTVRRLEEVWDQARGFIFVEKSGEAEDIQELSDYGWTIIAGQGYPTRLMRKLLKEDDRPVLALHDWDQDGEGIYRALGFETRRTWHLDIALGDRVVDLGLDENQVKLLDLPSRPSPPKYKGSPKVELSALNVLVTRMNLENPVLAFTVATILAKGLTLSPLEVSKLDMMQRHIRWGLTDGLSGVVEEAVKEITEKIKEEENFQGTAVKGELKDLRVIAPGLKEKLVESGLSQAEKTTWIYEDEIHEEAVKKLTSKELIDKLTPT